jgi:hypothetical protein
MGRVTPSYDKRNVTVTVPKGGTYLPMERLANTPTIQYDAGMSGIAQSRLYYSARLGGSQAIRLDLETLKTLFDSVYLHLQTNGFFDEAFGSYCVDAGEIEGTIGSNIEAYILFTLMKKNIWPIREKLKSYDEADLFDVIEFLFDHVSEPQQKDLHDWSGCGYHYSDFDKAKGQREYRNRINALLARYGEGYELTDKGELMVVAPPGAQHLLQAQLPTRDATVTEKVRLAVEKFRRYGSSMDERQSAVRDLADALEWLRPKIKETLLRADEQELFNLANNFGIRHLRQDQKLDYDRAVWLSWMFYHYLATINACLHLIERQKRTPAAKAAPKAAC